jgi:SAM-dependent methyltransferase
VANGGPASGSPASGSPASGSPASGSPASVNPASGSVVHGFDISPTLVDAARSRVNALADAPTFTVADLTTAEPPLLYDRLVSRFGVMFFDDERAAFGNLSRWLRPEGRFAFAVWASVAENPWLLSARDVVCSFAPMVPSAPTAPGPMRYANPSHFLTLLTEAGFVNLEVTEWRGLLPIGGGLEPSQAAHFALSALSSFSEVLTAAGDDAFARAHATLTSHYENHVRDGVVQLGATVHIVTGER